MEVAPENWIRYGGALGRRFAELAEQCPIILHGLSLNLGGTAPLDMDLVRNVHDFMHRHRCPLYSEHLTACGDHGHLYDLMPIPFTEEAVRHTAGRIRQVQDALGCRIAVENASYYAAPGQQMGERDFLLAVLEEADCNLLLDINNIQVNAINHGYEPLEFLRAMPRERIAYFHVAGHYVEAEDLRIDTHGDQVIEPVWDLLVESYRLFGIRPTLLERDFNFPPLEEMLAEVDHIRGLQTEAEVEVNAA